MVKILVIEDDEPIRELIDELLRVADFEVVSVSHGRQGLLLAQAHCPDLIICDIMMPELSGYQVLSELQAHPTTAKIPFIFLTALGSKQDIRQGMVNGADDYLTKPFTEEELLAVVKMRLRKQMTLQQHYQQQLNTAQAQLDYLLYHDPITALPNPLSLQATFQQTIADFPSSLSLLCVSLDRFSRINNGWGRDRGDLLLHEAAQRLSQILGNRGTLARLYGDEFAILLTDLDSCREKTQFAQELLKAFSQPFVIDDQTIFLSISIGIAHHTPESHTLEQLLQQASRAVEEAKRQGGNRAQFFDQLPIRPSLTDHFELESDLRYALERQELHLHYQPQVSLLTRSIVGAEALLRWEHPERGMISPALFIPLAEEIGCICAIGQWVLTTACRQMETWQSLVPLPIRIAVNLSGKQFSHQNLSQQVAQIIRNTGINPQFLELELTESILVENIAASIQQLKALKTLGINIAIDDFGTGYSSLSYLQKFPFDILKIDRCFVHQIHQNSKNAAIVQALIAMARQLQIRTIAEGVETPEEAQFLQNNHCNDIQGYLFSRPLPVSKFEELLISQDKLQ